MRGSCSLHRCNTYTLIDRDAAFRQFCDDCLERSWPALNEFERSQALARMVQRDRAVLKQDGKPIAISTSEECSDLETDSSAKQPDWHHRIWSDEWDEEKCRSLPRLIEPDAAVTELILRLRGRFRLAVVTNGSAAVQRAKLQAAGLADLFEHVIISGEVFVSKPDPKIFETALARLGCMAEEALFVGDDPIRDVIGGKNAGMSAAWICRGRHWNDVLDGSGRPLLYRPDYRVNHVNELEACVPCLT